MELYPVELQTQDTQFRALFPSAPKEDKVLLVFRACWNPNVQEFPGRVYVTVNDIYFYSHHIGLVLVSSIPLSVINDVEYMIEKGCDKIILNIGDDKITIKTFLDPVRLLHRRLQLLLHNYDTPLPNLFEELTRLDFQEDE